MFGAKRLSLNRDTESVVVLAPNVGLINLLLRIGIIAEPQPLERYTDSNCHHSDGNPKGWIQSVDPVLKPLNPLHSGLLPLLWPRSIRIDAALDLGNALIMTMNHANNRDHPTYYDGADRNQQTT
jgi:hypothetical protein